MDQLIFIHGGRSNIVACCTWWKISLFCVNTMRNRLRNRCCFVSRIPSQAPPLWTVARLPIPMPISHFKCQFCNPRIIVNSAINQFRIRARQEANTRPRPFKYTWREIMHAHFYQQNEMKIAFKLGVCVWSCVCVFVCRQQVALSMIG